MQPRKLSSFAAALLFACFVYGSLAGERTSILDDHERAHLRRALYELNMTEHDLGFDKDHGEPRLVFERVRGFLDQPLDLAGFAGDLLQDAGAGRRVDLWSLVSVLYGTVPAVPGVDDRPASSSEVLSPELLTEIDAFLEASARAKALLHLALEALSPEDRLYLAVSYLAGTYNAEDRDDVRQGLAALGASDSLVQQVIGESLALDPEPSASRYLDLVEKIHMPSLIEAGRIMQGATAHLRLQALAVRVWPDSREVITSPGGTILVGTRGDDEYTESALLILDPGGDDVYIDRAGAANGLQGAPLAAIVDLSGDDRYESEQLLGTACGLFGVAVVVDGGGSDFHRAAYAGQGAGIFGVGCLEDDGGDDFYKACAVAQGAGYVGLGMLRDTEGNDRYDVGLQGQGYAGLLGVGLLVDHWGEDVYMAGGQEPDHERHQDRFLSLSQGFAIGMRPFAGGGVAALIDLAGNDTYVADVYGQGVSYWYSAGLLIDAAGNDSYSMHHYGQGSGIHLSSGLLFDGAGSDMYSGFILAQGNAHDYAVGVLVDRDGDDTYTADHHAQGRALNTAFALLVDSAGNDAYFARQPDKAQGIGNDGDKREYGSLALLLDLSGSDSYSCGAANGGVLARPSYGVVYDFEENGREGDEENGGMGDGERGGGRD